MKRIWHPYTKWECYRHGMWRRVPRDQECELILEAVSFTEDTDLYGDWMIMAMRAFKISCEHHLSDQSTNKQAYIGHAACAFAAGLPEYLVRKAWGLLTEKQRREANLKADYAISLWFEMMGENGS